MPFGTTHASVKRSLGDGLVRCVRRLYKMHSDSGVLPFATRDPMAYFLRILGLIPPQRPQRAPFAQSPPDVPSPLRYLFSARHNARVDALADPRFAPPPPPTQQQHRRRNRPARPELTSGALPKWSLEAVRTGLLFSVVPQRERFFVYIISSTPSSSDYYHHHLPLANRPIGRERILSRTTTTTTTTANMVSKPHTWISLWFAIVVPVVIWDAMYMCVFPPLI
jgi:hypothetical protein